MSGVYSRDISRGYGRLPAVLFLIGIVLSALIVYFSYLNYTARVLGDDVYVSWVRLNRSLEAKAEASALLSGYMVRRTGAGREMFKRMFDYWEDILFSESSREKIEAGQRAIIESYGVIAMAESESSSLNERAKRILEGLETMELRLIADIESYNNSVVQLRARASEVYLGRLFIALSGCGDFELFAVGREVKD
ncbi:hypothetical protein ACFL4R_00030 [Nitrospirota bacterium]